ncbi:multidrug effflux MFS transporter [Actinoplanes sp. Pm04-4]|uniref:Multidrug effflux MFS transporter n=1 Tax=Paractinoplanes pyxinae TaxID=2997416 RepID=A0ABT4B1V4_9ACTN|nr:multidrug effflux MFS transporter [Actinoplanes pyxinae]MCY1140052.1 multidrug effflux MFS transporter [Actinoplanes pyxinae]
MLGALSAFGALTIDMYLPAMPGMASELRTSAPMVQLTLTVFVVGLAVGQVIVGPLSDTWGRRRPLVIGLAVYVAGSLWCAVAPTAGWLIGGRVLQSLGAAAGTVLARAIVRDLFSGTAMTRFFSTLMMINGVAPVVAPVVGGQLLTVATWRAVFLVLAAAGGVLLLAVVFALPESLPVRDRAPAHPRATLRTFRGLVTDWHYLRYVLAAALMFAAVFAYISGSSFVLQDAYGLSAQQFSLVFGFNGLGIVVLGQVGGLLVGRVATEHTLLRIALTVATVGAAGVLAGAVLNLALPLLLVSLFLVVSMLGVVLANATSLALAGHGSAAGSASSLQGLLQFLVGGLAASAMSLPGHITATGMATTMLVCSAAALTVLGVRR